MIVKLKRNLDHLVIQTLALFYSLIRRIIDSELKFQLLLGFCLFLILLFCISGIGVLYQEIKRVRRGNLYLSSERKEKVKKKVEKCGKNFNKCIGIFMAASGYCLYDRNRDGGDFAAIVVTLVC